MCLSHDLHALEAIDLLHFAQEILLHRPGTLDPQNVVRIHRSLRCRRSPASAPDRPRAPGRKLAGGHPVRSCGSCVVNAGQCTVGVRQLHEDLALAALESRRSGRCHRLSEIVAGSLGAPRFEQLGHPRQTAGGQVAAVLYAFGGTPWPAMLVPAVHLGPRPRWSAERLPGMTKSRSRFSLSPCPTSAPPRCAGGASFPRSSMMTRWRRPVISSSSSRDRSRLPRYPRTGRADRPPHPSWIGAGVAVPGTRIAWSLATLAPSSGATMGGRPAATWNRAVNRAAMLVAVRGRLEDDARPRS